MNSVKRFLRTLWQIRLTLVIILAPLLLLPLPIIHNNPPGKCAYVLLLMAVYWMTEAIPMAATALLPVALMPWLGVASAKQLSMNYLKDTNMIFLGGLMVAVAVEQWNLHKRLALRVLLLVGSRPQWLMFGFMSTTAFLSMWISNTATTAMMVPIVQAVLTELRQHRKSKSTTDHVAEGEVITETDPEQYRTVNNDPEAPGGTKVNGDDMNMQTTHLSDDPDTVKGRKRGKVDNANRVSPIEGGSQEAEAKEDADFAKMEKGMTMCVAYAANIGGTATLTGTGPNLVLKGQVDVLFGDAAGINFSSWFIFAFPNMMISLALAWLWLQVFFLRPRDVFWCWQKKDQHGDKYAAQVIRNEYNKLGPMSFAEAAVLVHFTVLAVLWVTREPEFIPGWSDLLGHNFVSDGTVALTIASLLFICPSKIPNYLCFRKRTDTSDPGPAPALLDWKMVHQKVPWGLILMLGGGFALADACKESGLSQVVGQMFQGLSGFPIWVMVFILCLVTATFTEVTSNVATASIFLPILAELAVSLRINPLYLLIPTTISTSFAFMLPVATPPNAIVFAYGHLRILDMVKTGILMNLLCIFVIQLSINTWGFRLFHLGTFPEWAERANHTAVAALPSAGPVTDNLASLS